MASDLGTLRPGMTESDALRTTMRLVEALREPCRSPDPTSRFALVETHISYIVLTGIRAYKIKKPLRLDFLDFATLESRRRACEDELRLNRRTAPDLYLRVVPITGTPDAPDIDGAGEPIEYAVEMRQFDPDALLATQIERGIVSVEIVDALAERIAAFHAELARGSGPLPAALEAANTLNAVGGAAASARKNVNEILALDPAPELCARIEQLAIWIDTTLERIEAELLVRRAAGFVRECHGDLHIANVALIDGRPVLFDCLEFDAALRWIDVIDEIAFAYMDFRAHGRPDLAARFANGYLEATGDYEGVAGLRFFAVHRALVRAKVALIRGRQLRIEAEVTERLAREVERHVEVAEALSRVQQPRLIITCGLAGSGKTTVSGTLVESLGAIRVRSDVERKRMAGLAADARSGSAVGEGLYEREASLRIYARLEQLAKAILESGHSAIVDAAFLTRRERAPFRALARAGGFEFRTVVCEAPVEVLRARVEARKAQGRDASEADSAVLDHQLAIHEPPAGDELEDVVTIATDQPIAKVLEDCFELGAALRGKD